MTDFLHVISRRLEAHSCTTIIAEGVGPERRSVSGAALLSRAGAFRAGLVDLGVRLGDRVVLVAANTADWVACDLAVLAEGAVLVPADPRQSKKDLQALIADAEPRLVLTGLGAPALKHQAVHTLEELASHGPASWSPPRHVPGDSLATIIYTSGSSGEPKGALLTRSNMDFMLGATEQCLRDLTGLPVGAERALHYLPLCYAGSRVLLLSCLLRCARLELVADPKQLKEAIGRANADYFLNVPLVLDRFMRAALDAVESRGPVPARLLREAQAAWTRSEEGAETTRDRLLLALADRVLFSAIRGRFGDRLKGVICGSAPLAEDTQRFFRMIGVEIYQGYGLTETTALCTLDSAGRVRPGWVGAALPGVDMTLSPEGEILTRGPHIFTGYWDRPEDTAAAFTREGWFKTGDLGDMDDAGRWRITGRKSAVLVLRTGHNVAPERVEEDLRRALQDQLGGAMADAQVVVVGHGKPHLVALLVIPPGAVAEVDVERALTRWNRDQAPKQRVYRFMLLDEPFSSDNGLLTANLKLRRKAIAARYEAEIDALYAEEPVPA